MGGKVHKSQMYYVIINMIQSIYAKNIKKNEDILCQTQVSQKFTWNGKIDLKVTNSNLL